MARIQALGIFSVVILVCYENWQRRRDRIARGEGSHSDLPVRFQGHPDLVDL
jgi:hypothetical protein